MAGKETLPVKQAQKGLWKPLRMFEDWSEEMDRWFDWPMFRRWPHWPQTRFSEWAPHMDVFEKGGKLMIKADLPGLKKEDVKVELIDGGLIIKGERHADHEVKEEDYYRMERSFGSFYRRLPLDFEVKAKDVKADFHDGLLEISIPKPPDKSKQAQKIEVH